MNVSSAARSLMHAFFLEHPEGDADSFELLRERHPEHAADLDRLHAEVARLRGVLHLSPASIVGSLSADPSPPERVGPLATARRAPRLLGFEVGEELGHGGMGVVWRSRDVELGRTVAVKVLRDTLAEDANLQRRFVTEARITGQLQHPGIVPVYRLGVSTEGRPFISMKLVAGRTLARLLAERESVDDRPLELLTIFARICEAVSYAHSRDVVHRDLKPANVMVGSFGEVQVLDWGLAKVLDEEDPESEDSVITPASPDEPSSDGSVAGTVVGTPQYMAPEQAAGWGERVGPRADVFSLGAMLCEVLTARPAYPRKRLSPLRAEAALAETCRLLAESDADRELVELTQACLAEDPEDRPADAGAVARAISDYLASVDKRARDAELRAAEARARADQERRARRQALVLGGVIVLALALASFAWRRSERHEAVAAEQAADTLENTRSLFDRSDYTGAAEVALSGLGQAGVLSAPERLELDRLWRNSELLASLARAGPRMTPDLRIEDVTAMRVECREAFVRHGVDVLEREPDVAARYLQAAEVGAQVRPYLDGWAQVERAPKGVPTKHGRKLLALAAALDDDEVRREIRHVLIGSDDRDEIREFLGVEFRDHLDPSTLALLLVTLQSLYGKPEEMGEFSDAREAALAVRDRAPSAVEVRVELGTICYGLGERERRLVRDENVGLSPSAVSFFNEAIEHLGAACALDPDNIPARVFLAKTYQLLGDERSREASFTELLHGMRAGRARENRILSRNMVMAGFTDRVVAHLDGLLEQTPENAEVSCELAWNLCHAQPRLPERAVTVARRALELEPDVRRYQRVLAMALYYAGEYGECADLLRGLREEGESTLYLNLMLAIAYQDLGFEEAEEFGRATLRQWKGGPDLITRSVVERARRLFGG